jgi:arylsulfatase
VLFVVWDDMGYGSWDLFGGLIEMPNMRRIADAGVRFTQFHTTALCSPTRASLLTGRNATTTGMGTIGELASGFPGLSCYVPPETGMISEVLRDSGYNTMCVGKWHLSPGNEMSLGSSKRTWPLGRGFDRFYGFLGGLTDQWYPDLWYDNHQVDPPASPADGYHLSKDLADKAIEFLADSAATAPTKPWLLYFAPGAGHAPHHVFKEWADKYKGAFDDGYEAYRVATLARQKDLGLVPGDVELPDINPLQAEVGAGGVEWLPSDVVIPWADLSEQERALFVRQAEVFAGYASYTDAQVGRILDHLQQTGQFENTIIVTLSDNGCSAEGGPHGSVNENVWYNGLTEDVTESLAHLDDLGSETTHPHFSNGWAMAFNTPFKMYKTNAAWEGGTADPFAICWPKGLAARGETRDEYLHVSDVVPTLYELLGIELPHVLGGATQVPLEGVSIAPVLRDAGAASPKSTQFYGMLGTRAMWRDGWQANTIHAPAPSGWSHFDQDRWCLYDLQHDRNQMHDKAQERPDLLDELKALWEAQAALYNGYPLDDRQALELMNVERPSVMGDRGEILLYPGGAEVAERVLPIVGRSFRVIAWMTVDHPSCEGVVFAAGGRFGGHSLYVKDGHLHYVYNMLGRFEQKMTSSTPLPAGEISVGVEFTKTGTDGTLPTGTSVLYVNDARVATMDVKVQPSFFSLSGEGNNVGRDRGQPVSSDYESPFALTGARIDRVLLRPGDDVYLDLERETAAAFNRD